jgi:hypothetical protein
MKGEDGQFEEKSAQRQQQADEHRRCIEHAGQNPDHIR